MAITLISTQTLASTASSVTFSSIPQTATDIFFVISARSTGSTNWQVLPRPNGSTSSLSARQLGGNGSSVYSQTSSTEAWAGDIERSSETANTFDSRIIYIQNYAGSTYKSMSADAASETNASGNQMGIYASLWASTAAITSMTFTMPGDSFAIGSTFSLYSVTKGSSGGVTVS